MATKKIRVVGFVPPAINSKMEELSEELEMTLGEVIKEAIKLLDVRHAAEKEGGTFVLEDRNGKQRHYLPLVSVEVSGDSGAGNPSRLKMELSQKKGELDLIPKDEYAGQN